MRFQTRIFSSPSAALCFTGFALLACAAKAQTVEGTVGLDFQSIDTTYTAYVYENGSQWGTPEGYAGVQTLSVTNLSSGSLGLADQSSLDLFCIELGQDTPGTSETYQILDGNSLAYVDSTNLPGTPNAQVNPAPFESNSGITSTGGIGAYRAGELNLLYGYAFGSGGVLSQGYNPKSLSAIDQVAFQLAVWKLSHEGSLAAPATLFTTPSGGVTANGFSVTGSIDSAVVGEANSLLSGVLSDNGITPMDLDVLNNGSYQDFLVPMDSFVQIPEPSACAAIFGIAALGCALVRRFAIAC